MEFFNAESGERILREWHYAKEQEGKTFSNESKEHSLVITDKRVVHIVKGKRGTYRQDVKLSKICACEASSTRQSKAAAIVFFILGAVLLFLPSALAKATETSFFDFLPLVGVVCIGFGVYFWKTAGFQFDVCIYVEGANSAPTVSLSANTFKGKAKKPSQFIKVMVDSHQAEEIVETFASVVFGQQVVPAPAGGVGKENL